jgi:type VI secretion system protein
MRAPARSTVTAALAVVLAACGTPPARVERITVVADSAANQNSATALDIVFVYDRVIVALLPRSGPDWFDRKHELLAGLASGIDVVQVELPPGMMLRPVLPARHAKAIAVYSFANYIAPEGQLIGNLTPYRDMTIKLMPDTIVYSGN